MVGNVQGRGRPAIEGRKTPITITDEQRERIGRLIEGKRLGEFVRAAIDNELDRREAEVAERS
ncbi:MAG: hypothetical protein KAG89_02400 [Fulvimarina manganoxydans]|uniref:hypothetical protein n=1 Tax=Fulvimarina manganoxydans TaxID=937218 RepID=UPI0023520A48|nr:hypothetical protein [Fulvimarina manganoxydans]MCK5930995.1 hypothetical protein [Fulvimarina manganoxydans]